MDASSSDHRQLLQTLVGGMQASKRYPAERTSYVHMGSEAQRARDSVCLFPHFMEFSHKRFARRVGGIEQRIRSK